MCNQRLWALGGKVNFIWKIFYELWFLFKVRGRFSIRIVPDQKPTDIDDAVIAYCNKIHRESGSANDIKYTNILFLLLN